MLSISGQANAVGQAGGGPVLGVIGNVWGVSAALAMGAAAIAPALGLYAARSPTRAASLSWPRFRSSLL